MINCCLLINRAKERLRILKDNKFFFLFYFYFVQIKAKKQTILALVQKTVLCTMLYFVRNISEPGNKIDFFTHKKFQFGIIEMKAIDSFKMKYVLKKIMINV